VFLSVQEQISSLQLNELRQVDLSPYLIDGYECMLTFYIDITMRLAYGPSSIGDPDTKVLPNITS
jgi:hypothetical protein